MTATATTSSLEWSNTDSHCNFLSSDLFGGDLFGDELIDMYSSVSDDSPELVASAATEEYSTDAELAGRDTADFGNLDAAKDYNDFSTLLAASTEQAVVHSLDDPTKATEGAQSLSGIGAQAARDAVSVATAMKIKKEKSPGVSKKRKNPEGAAPHHFARQVSNTSLPHAGDRMFSTMLRLQKNESAAKRAKAIQGHGEAKHTAATSRKAALAEAVAQYVPLAASQVSKIRQNASIFEKPNLRSSAKAVLNIANPLEQAKGAHQVVQNQKVSRPSTPIENKEKSSSLVSPSSISCPALSLRASVPFRTTSSGMPEIAAVTRTPFTPHAVALSQLPSVMALKAAENASSKISTAHVNALTSLNWSNTEAASTAVPCPLNADANKLAAVQAQKRRASLTVEDRAKQNRDRNREHARNTRLRKKAYVDELKKTLSEIASQRDSLELEKMRDSELRKVRFSVIQEFMKLRGSNAGDMKRWSSILDEKFVLNLPITHYRKMAHPNRLETKAPPLQQELKGISEVIQDASLLSEMLATTVVFECDRSSLMMDGPAVMVCWTAKTVGCTTQGAAHELGVKGNLRASFEASTNKLKLVEMFFDTNAVSLQLHSMYPLSYCDAVSHVHENADETAALLDSLNVPQFEGFLNETSHSISSESSADEKDDEDRHMLHQE